MFEQVILIGSITMGFIASFFILMSVRLLFLKNGKFKGTCASQNPFLKKEGGTCGYCGKNLDAGEECEKKDERTAVEKVLDKF